MKNFIAGQWEVNNGLSPDKIWFTSDHHFFHSKIIEYSKRRFANVDEMNEEMIVRWNSVVHRDHIVFHLGDFCFGEPEKWNYLLDRLKGKKYLIVGNHDIGFIDDSITQSFEKIAVQMKICIAGQKIYLNHFPFLCYSGENYGTWQLFGHVHSGPHRCNVMDQQRLKALLPTQYDVGVDNNDFTPVSFWQLEQIMKRQKQVSETEGNSQNEPLQLSK